MVSKLQERMFTNIPERWKPTFDRIREIDAELRCTDIRLINNPTDEQIDHFCGILLEGKKLYESVDMEDIQSEIGKNVLLENYLINFKEICRTQKVTVGYVWRKQIQKRKKEEEDQAS